MLFVLFRHCVHIVTFIEVTYSLYYSIYTLTLQWQVKGNTVVVFKLCAQIFTCIEDTYSLYYSRYYHCAMASQGEYLLLWFLGTVCILVLASRSVTPCTIQDTITDPWQVKGKTVLVFRHCEPIT